MPYRHIPKNAMDTYGREAMKKVLEFIRTFPAGPAQYCWISYKADNEPAKKLYESFGFCDSGEVIGDEQITVLRLNSRASITCV